MELLPLADPSEMEEEDVFFADLSRQLALLVMDDEEQLPVHMQYPPLPIRELPYMPQMMMPPPSYGYDQVAYRREMSKGTGVFIPRSTPAPRRKNISRNKCFPVENYNFPARRHLQKSAITVSHASNGERISCPSYCCSHSSVLIKRHVEQASSHELYFAASQASKRS